MCDKKDVYKIIEAVARAKMHLDVKSMEHSKECKEGQGKGCVCGAERVNNAIQKAKDELNIDRINL